MTCEVLSHIVKFLFGQCGSCDWFQPYTKSTNLCLLYYMSWIAVAGVKSVAISVYLPFQRYGIQLRVCKIVTYLKKMFSRNAVWKTGVVLMLIEHASDDTDVTWIPMARMKSQLRKVHIWLITSAFNAKCRRKSNLDNNKMWHLQIFSYFKC